MIVLEKLYVFLSVTSKVTKYVKLTNGIMSPHLLLLMQFSQDILLIRMVVQNISC